jgi:hypothetical protein
MPKHTPEIEGNSIKTKKANWPFWVTATTVCILNLVLWRMGKQGPAFPGPVHFIVYGILGLAILNCVAFTIPLLSAIKDAGRIDDKKLTREQQAKKAEQVMVPALQGRRDPPKRVYTITRLLFWICAGSIVGSAAAWVAAPVIEFNVAKSAT